MEEKKKGSGSIANLAKGAAESARQLLDQDGNGTIDINDFTQAAGSIGSSVKKAATSVKSTVISGAGKLGDQIERARIEAEFKALAPIFPYDLPRGDFSLSKLIRITDMDKKHAESELCVGSIGFESSQKELRIVNIYRDQLPAFGLSLYPDSEAEFYYADPSIPGQYIALDDYFSYLKIARVNELQMLAQDLGAKHFRVTYKEQKKTFSSRKGSIKGGTGNKGKDKNKLNAEASHESTETIFAAVEVAAEMDCIGHEPKIPTLVYFKNDKSIETLVKLRMDKNQVTHQKYTLNLSQSSGIKENDALKIDAALSAMKVSGNATVTSEAQSEARRIFEYEIDF